MISLEFKSIIDLMKAYPTEEACLKRLEVIRWPGGKVVSPFDPASKVYKCVDGKFKCKNTNKYFTAKTCTMFGSTKLELQKWFIAIFLITTHRKGISSVQLAKDLGITQKAAWFMLHRIRECFGIENNARLTGEIEMDETYVGGKNKNRHANKKVKNCRGRSYKDKTPVFGMVQRGGKAVARVVKDVKGNTLKSLIFNHVKPGEILYSDEWFAYVGLDRFYTHGVVDHGKKQWTNGAAHTNNAENMWSNIKRGILGIYHKVSKKHLQRYIDEYIFRRNTRDKSGCEVFNHLLSNNTFRLTYKQLVNGKEEKAA